MLPLIPCCGVEGLDSADQRYYSNQFGRFMTPDPYKASAGLQDPGSWNRYSYTRGDPVNRYDPLGLDDSPPFGFTSLPPDLLAFFFGGGAAGIETGSGIQPMPWDLLGISKPAYAKYVVANKDTLKVDATLGALRNALTSDSKCLSWLESGIAGNTPSVFNDFCNALTGASGSPLAGAENFGSSQLNAKTGGDSQFIIDVNTAGAFFNAGLGVGFANVYAKQVEALSSGTPQAQFFILIHELAHYFQVPGFIPDDGASVGRQAQNNDMVWEKCSKTVQGAGGGKA